MTIGVLIGDDQEIVRAGFRKLLDAEDTIIQVARGLSNREIASQLFLGEATIKT